ncbi:MAG: hypothetical protein PVH19_08410 [Planctomycetia bacterium]|jgi:MFS family permease
MNYVFFAIHLIVCFVALAAGIVFVGAYLTIDVDASAKDYSFLIGGAIAIAVSIVWLITEWHASIHRHIGCLRFLGFLFLVLAVLAILGFLVNVFLSLFGYSWRVDVDSLFIGSMIFSALFAYLFPVGLYRYRLSKIWSQEKAKRESQAVTAEVISQ